MPALLKNKPGGVGQYFENGVLVREEHTRKCVHCQKIVTFPTLKSMMDYMDFCRLCMAPICLDCYGKPCLHHMKRIEAAEEAYYRRRQFLTCIGD